MVVERKSAYVVELQLELLGKGLTLHNCMLPMFDKWAVLLMIASIPHNVKFKALINLCINLKIGSVLLVFQMVWIGYWELVGSTSYSDCIE